MPFVAERAVQKIPSSCLIDLTPPTFAGIATLGQNANGSLTATWLAGTDSNVPVTYEVFIQKNTATGLFVSGNSIGRFEALTVDIFELKNKELLQKGVTYHVGVRAVDAIGNKESNAISLSVVSSGILFDENKIALQELKNLVIAGL